jgi:hypothetical protein
MGRDREGPKKWLADFEGILQTDGYAAVRREVDSTIVRHGGFMQ